MRYPLEVMLVAVRWYAAYPLSLRQIEELMAERGVFVDHATVHRGSIKILPVPRSTSCIGWWLLGEGSFADVRPMRSQSRAKNR